MDREEYFNKVVDKINHKYPHGCGAGDIAKLIASEVEAEKRKARIEVAEKVKPFLQELLVELEEPQHYLIMAIGYIETVINQNQPEGVKK